MHRPTVGILELLRVALRHPETERVFLSGSHRSAIGCGVSAALSGDESDTEGWTAIGRWLRFKAYPGEMARLRGPDIPVPDGSRRLVCSRCVSPHADMVSTGTEGR